MQSNQIRIQILDLYKYAPIVGSNLVSGLHRLMSVVGRVSAAYRVSGKFSTNYHLVGIFALGIYDLEKNTDEPDQTLVSKVWRVDSDILVPAGIQEMNTTGILPYNSAQIDQPSWQQIAIPPEWPTAADWEEWPQIAVDINYSIRTYNRLDGNGEPETVTDHGRPMFHTVGDDIETIDVAAL